jgi:alcohol dehydrogenase YqhD (iron-dependent ADH family)
MDEHMMSINMGFIGACMVIDGIRRDLLFFVRHSSILNLRSILRFTKDRNPDPQKTVVDVFNEVLGWHENEAADCMQNFVKQLGLPTRLSEVGVTTDEQVSRIANRVLTDVWGGDKRQLEYDEIMEILNMVR